MIRSRKASALRFHEARALLEGLQFDEALQEFLAVQKGDPGADNVNYYAFLCAYYGKDYDAAERYAAEYARRSAPGFADVLRALPTEQRVQIAAMVQYLGDRAYQQKRIPNSRDLNHVTACLKDSADAWNNHAFLCRETGKFERAYTSYQYAIQKEPKLAPAVERRRRRAAVPPRIAEEPEEGPRDVREGHRARRQGPRRP